MQTGCKGQAQHQNVPGFPERNARKGMFLSRIIWTSDGCCRSKVPGFGKICAGLS